jgi:hypothetical protein
MLTPAQAVLLARVAEVDSAYANKGVVWHGRRYLGRSADLNFLRSALLVRHRREVAPVPVHHRQFEITDAGRAWLAEHGSRA